MAPVDRPLRILFLCTGNSCRSQMAEGFARALKSAEFEAHSAGTSPHGINPLAVRAMREVGIDISQHTSKRAEDIGLPLDIVITVCDSAHESCPVLPGARVFHVGFDDPPRLAKDARSDDEAMPHYRRVRDQIRAFVETLPEAVGVRSPAKTKGGSAMNSNDEACCAPGCCDDTPQKSTTMAPIGIAPLGSVSVGSASAGGSTAAVTEDEIRAKVRAGYSQIANSGSWSALAESNAPSAGGCCGPATSSSGGGCCGPSDFSPDQLATAIGYSQGDLAITPESANMGLSCGNPTALASLKSGEVVLDLGAGGGFDCFIAGAKVGATGKVIGVDMTPDMLSKARRNIATYRARTGLDNVEFRLGEIENLPVADGSVDVVISNCVLNLSPDKARVWREVARVLKPGGRVAISDLALLRPLPAAVKNDVEALVGCVAGAVLVSETHAQATAAGLVDLALSHKPHYVEAMVEFDDPLYKKVLAALPSGTKPSDFVTSLDVAARKPS